MSNLRHRPQNLTIPLCTSRALPSFVFILVVCCALPATAANGPSTVEKIADEFLSMAHYSLATAAESGLQTAWVLKPIKIAGEGHKSRFSSILAGLIANRLAKRAYRRLPIQLSSTIALDRKNLIRSARSAGVEQLLVVDAFDQRNHIHLVGELIGVSVSFWSGVRHPVAGIRNHFYASARLDAELRALLDMALPSTGRARQFEFRPLVTGLPRRKIYAVGAGDLDGDGLSELVRLTASGVDAVRIIGASAGEPIASYETSLLVRSPIKLRERFGTMAVVDINNDGRSEVLFWRSDLKAGSVLTFDGDTLRPLVRIRAGSTCGMPEPIGAEVTLCGAPLAARLDHQLPVIFIGQLESGTNHFLPQYSTWSLNHSGTVRSAPELHWGMAAHAIKLPKMGKFLHVLATVNRKGVATIRSRTSSWKVANVGTALTFVDMNDDGQAEFVRSSKTFIGQRDDVALYELGPSGKAKRLWRKRKSAIDGVCSADGNNDGFNDVLVVSGRKVHLLSERR